MAGFDFNGIDELTRELEKLGILAEDIGFHMVNEGAKIMDEELRQEIRASTQKYGTGALAESIDHNEPVRGKAGIYTASTARGIDTKKGKYGKKTHKSYNGKTGEYAGTRSSYGNGAIRNHDKLFYLEYGNSRQKPHPIIQKCVNRAEPKVLKKMQEVFERETSQ